MTNLQYHQSNSHRYNIYEDNFCSNDLPKSYYKVSTKIFIIGTVLSALILTLTSLSQKKVSVTKKLQISQIHHTPVQNNITDKELTSIISNTIIQKSKTKTINRSISDTQLKYVIKNVMENIKYSSNNFNNTQ